MTPTLTPDQLKAVVALALAGAPDEAIGRLVHNFLIQNGEQNAKQ